MTCWTIHGDYVASSCIGLTYPDSQKGTAVVVPTPCIPQWETSEESSTRGVIHSDASLLGWGTTCQGIQIGGAWTKKELNLHINCLELLGAWNAVQAFCLNKTNLVVIIWMDNSSAVTYINHMGGTRSTALAEIAIQFWTWALQRGIILRARHIAGVKNVTADKMSRMSVRDRSDWSQ